MSTPFQPVKRINYVIDTSVLAFQGEAIHNFAGHNVYIPIEVLEELDNLKTRMDQVGSACRYVNRYLDQIRELGNLAEGVEIENEQFIIVTSSSNMENLPEGLSDTVDNRIISVAAGLIQDGEETVVVSRDISLRIRCDSLSIPAENYEGKNSSTAEYIFEGLTKIEVDKFMIDKFYAEDYLEIEDAELYPNQGVILKSGQSSALAIAESKDSVRKLKFANDKGFNVQGISPRSKEQIVALELLLDPEISMVSLTGFAGTGKTMLSIAAALELIHQKKYKKLIISRPVQSTSKDIGFLPGTKEEKLAPWLQPIFDNIDVILGDRGHSYIDLMFERGIIEVEALTYIRGRTLPDTIFIIDEAQNISHHEAKALLTRMGENSKIILIGDLEQIDSPSLNQDNSGLTSVIELFKEFEGSGHIRLKKGERSDLASYAAKVM